MNRYVRAAATVLGVLTLYGQVASATAYNAHLVVCGALLVLAPLHRRDEQPWLVRGLASTVLAASALVQLTTPSWLDGRMIESWTVGGLAHPLYSWLSVQLPAGWLSAATAWFVIAAELALSVFLLLPGFRRDAVWALALGLILHGFCLATREMQALAIVMGICGLSFLRWPDRAVTVLWPRACGFPLWLRIALDRYDFDGRLDWPLPPDPDAILEVVLDERHFEDSRALTALLLHFPAFLLLAFVIVWGAHLAFPAAIGSVVYAMLIGPVLALFAMRRIRRVLRLPGGAPAGS